MEINNIIRNFEEIHKRLIDSLPQRIRPVSLESNISEKRAVIVYGLRGVGKTVFLLNASKNKNFLYFSADNPLIYNIPIIELIDKIFKSGYDGVVIDEIHFSKDWAAHLKSAYDSYPSKTIWVSGSSNLVLKKDLADLSRRFLSVHLPLLSFREYIYLKEGIMLDKINLFESIKNYDNIKSKKINVLKLFKEHINGGIRPIFYEGDYSERLKNMIEKSVFYDIPFYINTITDNYLRLMNGIIGHLITSPIPTLNISKMTSEWEIGKHKLYFLLEIMDKMELIKIIKPKNKKHTYTKGSKIFLTDSSIYSCFNGNLGNIRESYFVNSVSKSYPIYSSENEDEYDYLVGDLKLEIGGKSKSLKKADFVISDDIEMPVKNRIPLWMAGLTY